MSEPEDSKPVEVLIQSYVAGQLTPAEAKDFLGCLQECPALGAEVLDHLRTDEMLSQLIQARSFGSPLVGSDGERHTAPRPNPVPFRVMNLKPYLAWATALAACLAVLVGLGLLWRPQPVVSRKGTLGNGRIRCAPESRFVSATPRLQQ